MKSVRIAELKARLSRYLREARSGASITVLDRDTPIARIVPVAKQDRSLVARRPKRGAGRVSAVELSPPLRAKTDVVALLLEEREGRR